MEAKLKFTYDRIGDILHIDMVKPYAEQECEELDDGVIARFHPTTNEVENIEILFYSHRMSRDDSFELPLKATFRLAV